MKDNNYSSKQESDIVSGALRLPAGYTLPEHEHGDHFTTVRVATHLGKEIRVETTYCISIVGVPVTAHIGVADDGSVHSHGLPNYSFPSAIELAKRLVSEVELPPNELTTGTEGGHH